MKSRSVRVLSFVAVVAFVLASSTAVAQPETMAAPAMTAAPAMAAPVMAPAPAMAAPRPASMVAAAPKPVASPMVVAAPAMVAAPAPAAPAPAAPAAAAPVAEPAMAAPAMSAEAAPEAAMVATPAAQPTAQPAAEKTAPWWKTLLSGLISLLLVFLGSLATGAGIILIRWLSKKLNVAQVESLAAVEKLYESAIELGINFADQQARKLGGTPDANGKRLEWAIEKAKETIKDLGLAEKATDWITTRIEAKLGLKNAGKPVSTPSEPPEAADTPA